MQKMWIKTKGVPLKMPLCFYQKAFWIVIPLLVVMVSSTFAVAQDQQAILSERVTDNSIQIAENNVPEVKKVVDGIDTKVDSILLSQARIEAQLQLLLP